MKILWKNLCVVFKKFDVKFNQFPYKESLCPYKVIGWNFELDYFKNCTLKHAETFNFFSWNSSNWHKVSLWPMTCLSTFKYITIVYISFEVGFSCNTISNIPQQQQQQKHDKEKISLRLTMLISSLSFWTVQINLFEY